MKTNVLGRTGLRVSALGFGCGFVGGLMVRGSTADQERAIARCAELGINYYDTAPHYGNGLSEENLGRALAQCRVEAVVGTKVMVPATAGTDVADAVTRSVEDSLRRLRRDHIDLLQLHNGLSENPSGNGLTPARVLDAVVPVFDAMRRAGKIRFVGMTGLGETAPIRRVLESDVFDSVQIAFNLLNPSAVEFRAGAGMPQNYEQLSQLAQARKMGTIGIRILAGGALSGVSERHPVALGKVDPIGSGDSYAGDVSDARHFDPLVDEGHTESLVDLATRYALSSVFSTIVIGFSSLDQIETAAASASRGPLSAAATARIAEIHKQLAAVTRSAR